MRSWVSVYQSFANTARSEVTVGPSMRATSSTHSRPAAWFFGLVVARLDQVLRSHEGHPAVDDQDLAVVAQVGTLELTLERPDREHRSPVDAGAVQPLSKSAYPGMPRDPMWSNSSRTFTPRAAAATRASKKGAVTSSQAEM